MREETALFESKVPLHFVIHLFFQITYKSTIAQATINAHRMVNGINGST